MTEQAEPRGSTAPARSRTAEYVFAAVLVAASAGLLVAAVTGSAKGGRYTWSREAPAAGALDAAQARQVLRAVQDKELGVDILDLGLVYDVQVPEPGRVAVTMTLTSPTCPFSKEMLGDVRDALLAHPAVSRVDLDLVFEPAWTFERVAPAARARLVNGPAHVHAGEAHP